MLLKAAAVPLKLTVSRAVPSKAQELILAVRDVRVTVLRLEHWLKQ
jgi:hypothetical protein